MLVLFCNVAGANVEEELTLPTVVDAERENVFLQNYKINIKIVSKLEMVIKDCLPR